MRTIQFNFNNEVDVLILNQNVETGQITVPENPNMPTFESIESFAEYYALARTVKAENLKNWTLVENGDMYTYSLRAGTAGIASQDIIEALNEAIDEAGAEGEFHVLVIEAFRNRVKRAEDLVQALTNDENGALAQSVYDKLNAVGALAEAEVDNRSQLEVALDEAMENYGTIALFAHALNLPLDSEKAAIVHAAGLAEVHAAYLLSNAISNLEATTGVSDIILLSALVTQSAVGILDADTVKRVKATASFAGQTSVNIRTIKVGARFVQDSASYVALDSLTEDNVRTVDGKPVIFVFDHSIDAVVEAELVARRAEEAEREAAYAAAYAAAYDEDDSDEYWG